MLTMTSSRSFRSRAKVREFRFVAPLSENNVVSDRERLLAEINDIDITRRQQGLGVDDLST